MQPVSRALLALCRGPQVLRNAATFCAASPATAAASFSSSTKGLRWVFLGPPGVGKGTYASRIAAALHVPHIAAGDLVRAEIKSGSALGREMQAAVSTGQLLPDDIIIEVKSKACCAATEIAR